MALAKAVLERAPGTLRTGGHDHTPAVHAHVHAGSFNGIRYLPRNWRLPRFEYVESPLSATLAESGIDDGDWLEAVVLVQSVSV